jgi:hypothetical protein
MKYTALIGNAALKYLVGHRSIKVKEIIFTQAVIMLRLLLTVTCCSLNSTRKTCILCGYDGWLWPQICKKRKRLAYILQNKLPCIDRAIKWQMPGTNIFTNLEQLFCSSHNHSICILSFINPLISMEYVIKNK